MQPNNYLKKQSLLFLIGETLKYMICSNHDTKKIENYFEKIYLEERLKVKYIIIDTWESYRDVAKRYFKNAKTAMNSFHIMEHIKKQTIQ